MHLIQVTKIDMCPENVLARTKNQVTRILKSPAAGKKLPLTIREVGFIMPLSLYSLP